MSDEPIPRTNCPEGCRVTNHIPMVHVTDVDKSIAFYGLLGFSCNSQFSGPSGTTNWASLSSERAHIMFARAEFYPTPRASVGEVAPIVPSQQAVLFYMYSRDVMALLKCGLADGGKLSSESEPVERGTPIPERNAVFRPTFPFYMTAGEVRIHDPDGYCILVGQLES